MIDCVVEVLLPTNCRCGEAKSRGGEESSSKCVLEGNKAVRKRRQGWPLSRDQQALLCLSGYLLAFLVRTNASEVDGGQRAVYAGGSL